ncbi:hypothetical protein B9Z55_027805 [Caenorhabditis nigoni]|nr:hypothetical protein B9Z55_027805 [Caenorhabditis nigoni]
MTSNQLYHEAFRYIAENVKEYEIPENFPLWRKESKHAVSYVGTRRDFNEALERRMNNIAKKWNAEGYTFLEKVHLVFIFSWPVSNEFVKIVQEAKCTIQLDKKERIKYFRSEDGSVILSSDHKPDEQFFKGTLLTAKRYRTLLFSNVAEVLPSQPTDPEPAKNSNVKLENPDSEESESEDEAPTNSQNSELSRIQNGPFNVRINYDELDEKELDDVTVLNEERSFDRKPEKRPQNSLSSSNAPRPSDASALPPIIEMTTENLKEMVSPYDCQTDGRTFCGLCHTAFLRSRNRRNHTHWYLISEENSYLEEKFFFPLKTPGKVHSILNPDMTLDSRIGHLRRLFKEYSKDRRIDKNIDLGDAKRVRPNQPTDPESAKNSNEKLKNPDSEESESEDEAPTNVSDSQNSEYSRIQNGPINGRINYDELDEQALEDVTVLKHERSRKPEKRTQNSWSSENAKKVKVEEYDEDFFAAPCAPKALNIPEESKINVLLLANNIGIIALYCDLEDVQKKASRAIEMIKTEKREMTLSVADFNSFIDSMLRSIKRSRIRSSCQNEKFLPPKTIYRHIKLSLILPFGPEIAGEALKIVDKEIEELGESHHEVETKKSIILKKTSRFHWRRFAGIWNIC